MSDVSAYVDVRVPPRTAYNQWTQFESFPEFMPGVIAVRQLDDRHTHWVTEVAGTRREFDAEIVEQLPDDRIAWRSIGGDVRHSGTVTFRLLDRGATRVTVDLAWEPKGLVEKAGSVVGADHLEIKADLDRFRRFIEERGAETGQWRGRIPEPPATAEKAQKTEKTEKTEEIEKREKTEATLVTAGHDVIDILVAQHQQLKDLMARISAAEGAERKRLFAEFMTLLTAHEEGEQHVVHRVTRSSLEDGEATAGARLSEEERADRLLVEVAKITDDSHEFTTWFEQLRNVVLDHAEHEERGEFSKLRQELAPARLRTMADELVAVQTART
jgi:hemerythrin superfamily protein/ribosome-associated toxin RatA of RatAB toxin-antitoxin module